MRQPAVFVVSRALKSHTRIHSGDLGLAFGLAYGPIGRYLRSYVEIVDEAAVRWRGTHASAVSTPSSVAGYITESYA